MGGVARDLPRKAFPTADDRGETKALAKVAKLNKMTERTNMMDYLLEGGLKEMRKQVRRFRLLQRYNQTRPSGFVSYCGVVDSGTSTIVDVCQDFSKRETMTTRA